MALPASGAEALRWGRSWSARQEHYSKLRAGIKRVAHRGLVTDAISDHRVLYEAVLRPSALIVRRRGIEYICIHHERGRIREYSYRSARRLREVVAGVDFTTWPATFQTLTYHERWHKSADAWHADLARYLRHFFRDWQAFGPSVIWRQEFQKRGAVHFHLLFVWEREPKLEHLRSWSDRAWNDVAEPGDDTALRVGVNTVPVRLEQDAGVDRLMRYLSKYLSKNDQAERSEATADGDGLTGRWWGVWGPLPQMESRPIPLSWEQYVALVNAVRLRGRESRYLQKIGSRGQGFLLYGAPDSNLELLRGIHMPGSEERPCERPPPDPSWCDARVIGKVARETRLDRAWWEARIRQE